MRGVLDSRLIRAGYATHLVSNSSSLVLAILTLELASSRPLLLHEFPSQTGHAEDILLTRDYPIGRHDFICLIFIYRAIQAWYLSWNCLLGVLKYVLPLV